MNDITRTAYYEEIRSIADSLVSDAMEQCENDRDAAEESINDSMLHETIDSHQWVIYTAYNLDVLKHSESQDAYTDNFGADDAGHVLKDRGIDGLHAVMAYCAMEQDVRNVLNDAFDDYIEAQKSKTA